MAGRFRRWFNRKARSSLSRLCADQSARTVSVAEESRARRSRGLTAVSATQGENLRNRQRPRIAIAGSLSGLINSGTMFEHVSLAKSNAGTYDRNGR
jgi:hypothetical protein